MKKVIVNQKNIDMVYGMLKKFFLNKSFIEWHTFSGGSKKRIPTHFLGFDLKFLEDGTVIKYAAVCKVRNHASNFDVELKNNIFRKKVIAITYNEEEGFLVEDGTELMFLGNRVNVKEPKFFGNKYEKYIYTCYQIANGYAPCTYSSEPCTGPLAYEKIIK